VRTGGIVAIVVLSACGGDGGGEGSAPTDASTTASSAADDDGSSTNASPDSSGTAPGSTDEGSTSIATTTDGGTESGGTFDGCFHTWTFDGCADGWEIGVVDPAALGQPSWECGEAPGALSLDGAHTGIWATSLAGDYNEDESSYLASPSFSLADCAGATVYLQFAHLYEFGSGDGGVVQISLDGGASWTTLVPSWHGYCAGTLDVPWSPPGGEPGFCGGNDQVWTHSLVPLDAYAGEPDVRVRFVIGADGIIEQLGWYIDSVATEAY